MLFLLTGDVQIGKTRWLEGLIAELQQAGVGVAGVLAPGQWVPSHSPDADKNGFEKLGIDNVLLPEGRRIPFARREDLARAEGAFDEDSQSARLQLAWHISDEAIAQVNAHFDGLMADGVPLTAPSLLVVDELGRLELWAGEGLTSALELLRQGPSELFPHALVVVRDYLLDAAQQLLLPAWGEAVRIAPNHQSRELVVGAYSQPSNWEL